MFDYGTWKPRPTINYYTFELFIIINKISHRNMYYYIMYHRLHIRCRLLCTMSQYTIYYGSFMPFFFGWDFYLLDAFSKHIPRGSYVFASCSALWRFGILILGGHFQNMFSESACFFRVLVPLAAGIEISSKSRA